MIWQVLQGVWPPLLVVVPLLFAARRPRAIERTGPGGAWAPGLGVALGFAAAYWALKGAPFPPADANRWHVVLVVAAGALGAMTFLPRTPWTVLALALLAASPLVMFSRLWGSWDGGEGFVQLGVSAVVVTALGALLTPLGERSRGAALPLAMAVVTGAGGYVLFAGHSASLGQLSGALAAGFGTLAAFALYQPGLSSGRGGALVGALGLGGLVLLGHHLAYQTPPVLPRLLLLAAVPCAWVERCRCLRDRSNLVRAAVTGAVVAIPAAAAMWMASAEFEEGY